ncbi:hypothetical protein EEK40_00135 [Salmonella enterica]|uniref:Uncharacterized protein n=2 Tax=Salmonella enterica I TaxID=59201 RepID=A0A5U9IA01_SALET|nr:hypothetical protein [Salmonella enterica]EBS2301914.1 hypothetical protein [Salmonella enterica subsp. enterica serovar Saintpaul]EBV4909127.1 hypothetical protein [Salmonella enterica subsp. enterica serovar Kalamu]EBZ8464574.1 hypothetical protein [Salmonella enterica subsp. enterica serovar Mishmarhaemek]ECH8538401.1 hypothetical protein [Salmonella enterica subsp. enterica]
MYGGCLECIGLYSEFFIEVFTSFIYKFIFNGNPCFFRIKNPTIVPVCIYTMNFFILFSHNPQNIIDPRN